MERSKRERESLNVRMRHGDDREMEMRHKLEPLSLSHSVMCKESD